MITDGKNPNIIKTLKEHPSLNVRTVPEDLSWVGGKYIACPLLRVVDFSNMCTIQNFKLLLTSLVYVFMSQGDMMLGVLSSVFIGTPISTLSGNIARARVALGFDPKSNYMFPKKRHSGKEGWDFACESAECLYDTRFLSHYVG